MKYRVVTYLICIGDLCKYRKPKPVRASAVKCPKLALFEYS